MNPHEFEVGATYENERGDRYRYYGRDAYMGEVTLEFAFIDERGKTHYPLLHVHPDAELIERRYGKLKKVEVQA